MVDDVIEQDETGSEPEKPEAESGIYPRLHQDISDIENAGLRKILLTIGSVVCRTETELKAFKKRQSGKEISPSVEKIIEEAKHILGGMIAKRAADVAEEETAKILPEQTDKYLASEEGQKRISSALEQAAANSSVIEKFAIGRLTRLFTRGLVIFGCVVGLGLGSLYVYRIGKDSAATLRGEIAKVDTKVENDRGAYGKHFDELDKRSSTLELSLSSLEKAVNLYRAETLARFDDPEEGIFPKLQKLDEDVDRRVRRAISDKVGDYGEFTGKVNDLSDNYKVILDTMSRLEASALKKEDIKDLRRQLDEITEKMDTFISTYETKTKPENEKTIQELRDRYRGLQQRFDALQPPQSQPASQPSPELKLEYQPAE